MNDNWMTLGAELDRLATEHGTWSQATFGTDSERGPIGPLKHLEKEAREARAEAERFATTQILVRQYDALNNLEVELADCLLLLLDATRRSGLTPLQLIRAAQEKLEINRTREWSKPTSDEPVEHVRTEETK